MSAFTATSAVRRDRHPLSDSVYDEVQPPIRPTRRRSSLPVEARNAYAVYPADIVEGVAGDADDLSLVEDPITNSEKISPRTMRRALVAVQPPQQQAFPCWVKIAFWVVAIVVVIWMVVRLILTVMDFCTDVSNTYHYGPTRTTVVSGVFGHNDSPTNQTEIVAVNLHGTLLIQEVPGGDVLKTRTYPTGLMLVGDAAAKTPIILSIKDLNGDHRPDVLIEIPGQSITLKLFNTGTAFTLAK